MRTHLLAVAAVAALGPICHADVLLGSFENSMAGSLEGTWSVSSASQAYSPTGATDGASTVALTPGAPGFAWTLALNGNAVLRDAILANDAIAFDVTVPSGPQTPGVWEYMVFGAAFNSAGGWQQTPTNVTRSGGGDNAWNTDKVTFVWDYPANVVSAASSWSQFNIALNSGNLGGNPPPTVYIDNVRLVPEPAALGLVAVAGGAMALGRRRRKA